MTTATATTSATVLVLALGLPGLLAAQGHQHPSPGDTRRERYSIPAVRVDQSPKIDGVLDEQVWKKAPLVEDFIAAGAARRRDGDASAPKCASCTTARTLLIGVHAFDAQPSAIVATEMRRDSDRLLDEDNFQLILDTFNDSRNGYMFVTTPLGAKLEQQISEEGEGNNRAGLVNSNINKNWDGIWDVAAPDHRRRLDGGDRHPAHHAALSPTARSRRGASTSCGTSAARTSRCSGRRSRRRTR